MNKVRKIPIILGGVRLFPPAHVLYATRVSGVVTPKLVSLAGYRTIAAKHCFRGKAENYQLGLGCILGWRKGDGGSKIWYHFQSIYEAVRSFHHAGESEAQAHENIHVGIQTALELVSNLLISWPLSDQQREDLNQKMEELYGQLENTRDYSLVDAAECVFDALGFEDGEGISRLHPSTAKIYTARRLMSVRLRDIARIVPKISHMQIALTAELAEERHVFLEYDLNLLLEARRIARNPQGVGALDQVGQRLRLARDTFGVVRVAPFCVSAGKVRKLVLQALEILYPSTAEAKLVSIPTRVTRAQCLLSEMIQEIACVRARDFLEERIIRPVSCAVLTPGQRRKLEGRINLFVSKVGALNLDTELALALRVALRCASQDIRTNNIERAKQFLKDATELL